MNDAITAAPAAYPESWMTKEEVLEAIHDCEARLSRLFERFCELDGSASEMDKRTQFNPIRNLKISANRAYQWAKRAGCDAEEARKRAVYATLDAAAEKCPSLLEDGRTLPTEVTEYIEKMFREY